MSLWRLNDFSQDRALALFPVPSARLLSCGLRTHTRPRSLASSPAPPSISLPVQDMDSPRSPQPDGLPQSIRHILADSTLRSLLPTRACGAAVLKTLRPMAPAPRFRPKRSNANAALSRTCQATAHVCSGAVPNLWTTRRRRDATSARPYACPSSPPAAYTSKHVLWAWASRAAKGHGRRGECKHPAAERHGRQGVPNMLPLPLGQGTSMQSEQCHRALDTAAPLCQGLP